MLVMLESVSDSPEANRNMSTRVPQVSTIVQRACELQSGQNMVQVSTPMLTNVFIEILQGTLEFNTSHIKVPAEDVNDTQDAVLYWKFTEIKEFCQLKANIPANPGGIYFGDRKIKCL